MTPTIRSYLALIEITLMLSVREKVVLFFNFLFPLLFFFVFAQMMGASQGGVGVRVVSMVLVLGVLGNGLFGAGSRTVIERETNILRRYKVTPISPAPILVASIVTGWLLYLPVVFLIVGLARVLYGVEVPQQWGALVVLLSVGAWSMRSIGLIVASVVNSTAESNILIQLLYMPMLFLSGATFPMSSLPDWAQIAAQFLPASYLHNGMERIMIRNETLGEVLTPILALLLSTLLATLISMKIFRWEKDEALPRSAKLWLVVVGLPFIALGLHQAYSRDNIDQAGALDRALSRNRTRLIRGARIIASDGTVIDSGGLLIRNGKIAEVYSSAVPDPVSVNAELVEASGKTVLPGLIDMQVRLSEASGAPISSGGGDSLRPMERNLAAYLYSGITAVRSMGDEPESVLSLRGRLASGELLGAELFLDDRHLIGEGGPGIGNTRGARLQTRLTNDVKSSWQVPAFEDIQRQAAALTAPGTDTIDAVLEAGQAGAVARGSFMELIPEDLFTRMAQAGIAYNPALVAGEAFLELRQGRTEILSRSLVEQVAPPGMIDAIRANIGAGHEIAGLPVDLGIAKENLLRAYRAGVTLVAGSDSGGPLVIHGPGIHRELQLWVEAGIPPAAALGAATHNAANLLGAGDRIGLIHPGYEASLLLVDGNPLENISATERISVVLFKGELLDRTGLLGN